MTIVTYAITYSVVGLVSIGSTKLLVDLGFNLSNQQEITQTIEEDDEFYFG